MRGSAASCVDTSHRMPSSINCSRVVNRIGIERIEMAIPDMSPAFGTLIALIYRA